MNQNRTVALYGNKQELSTFADRIRELLPGGNKLSGQQAMALAQVSAIHGLDPFNGEVWHLPQGIQIGIKGLRKKARQQMGDKGNFWATFREIVDPEERKRLMIDGGCLAFECRLFDTQTLQAFSDTIKTLRGAEVPIDAIMRIVGDKPYTTGIGVFKTGERSMMLPAQCAMKRAEADAIKRRFDVPFEVAEEELPASPATQYVDGRVVDADTGEIHGDASRGAQSAAELFGTAEIVTNAEVQQEEEHEAASDSGYKMPSGPAKPVKAGPGDKPKTDAGQCEVHDVPLDWHYSKAKETWYAGHRTGNGDACWGRKQKETAAVGK